MVHRLLPWAHLSVHPVINEQPLLSSMFANQLNIKMIPLVFTLQGVAVYKGCPGSKKHHACTLVTLVLQKHSMSHGLMKYLFYKIHNSEIELTLSCFFNQAGIDLSISEGLHLLSFEHTDDQTDDVNWQANVDACCGHIDSGWLKLCPGHNLRVGLVQILHLSSTRVHTFIVKQQANSHTHFHYHYVHYGQWLKR